MALVDFATVQLYRMDDLIEVVFPYDKAFGNFLKELKGRWAPQRKCWQLKPEFCGKSAEELVYAIEEHLRSKAPKNWEKVVALLRSNGCVSTEYEIFAGLGGLKLSMPLGHPYHHHLKQLHGLENRRKEWQIPSRFFKEKVVQEAVERLHAEDWKKYRSLLAPVEERCLIGDIKLSAADGEAYGMKKGAYIAVQPSFLQTADRAMSDLPLRELAFEVLKLERKDSETLKIRIEYAEPKDGYAHLRPRRFDKSAARALDHSHIIDDEWIQRRS